MVISELAWTKRRRLVGAVVICVVLVASLTILWQMGQVAEAAILTPYNFYDDFSGDLSQWTVVSGTWAIENSEYSQSDETRGRLHSIAGDPNWIDYTIEAKAKILSGMGAMIFFRYVDTNWYEAFIRADINVAVISKHVAGELTWIASTPFTSEAGVWYELKVEVKGSNIRFYVDGALILETTDPTFTKGKTGLATLNAHVHFDDVIVSDASGADIPPSTYSVNVRAGVTQIIVTCTWSGSGNISIKLVGPTTTYYESDMKRPRCPPTQQLQAS